MKIAEFFTIVKNLLHGKVKKCVFVITEGCPTAVFYHVVAVNLLLWYKGKSSIRMQTAVSGDIWLLFKCIKIWGFLMFNLMTLLSLVIL